MHTLQRPARRRDSGAAKLRRARAGAQPEAGHGQHRAADAESEASDHDLGGRIVGELMCFNIKNGF